MGQRISIFEPKLAAELTNNIFATIDMNEIIEILYNDSKLITLIIYGLKIVQKR